MYSKERHFEPHKSLKSLALCTFYGTMKLGEPVPTGGCVWTPKVLDGWQIAYRKTSNKRHGPRNPGV